MGIEAPEKNQTNMFGELKRMGLGAPEKKLNEFVG
jgi:hypothetical protein